MKQSLWFMVYYLNSYELLPSVLFSHPGGKMDIAPIGFQGIILLAM